MSAPVTVTQLDRDAVTAFHNVQLQRIFVGDRALGDGRDAIEQAFARHRMAAEAASKAREAELVEALELALEYWAHRQKRYKNRHPVWVGKAKTSLARAKATSDGEVG